MNPIFHARKKRQLRYMVKRLKGLLKEGQSVSQLKVESLVKKIKALVKELSGVLAPLHLRKILGSAALILGMSFGNGAVAQSFAAPQENPFGLTSVYEYAFPSFADLDGDGDMDLLVGEPEGPSTASLHYFENIGTASSPQYTAPQTNPFGLTTESDMLLIPALVDLDNDGDLDLMIPTVDIYAYAANVRYFENTGSATDPQFAAPIENPFGLASGNLLEVPAFVDLDNDGDYDMIKTLFGGGINYYENTGSPAAPQFATPVQNPFGLNSSTYEIAPAFVDLDVDGDMDLFIGDAEDGTLYYRENTGTPSSPQFEPAQQNPFGLVSTNASALPTFADLDDDDDMDLLVGEYYGTMQYFENISSVGVDEKYSNNKLDLYPNPVSNILSIDTDIPFEKIEAYDALGRLIDVFDRSAPSIDVSKWATGIHVLKFMDTEGAFATKSIVKE